MTAPRPGISVAQMRVVDRMMNEDYGIELLQKMESAGRSLAAFVRAQLADTVAG